MGATWHRIGSAVVVVVGSGCGASVQYGSFLEDQETAQASIAADAARKLKQEYPPEHNSVQLLHAAKDPFGQSLIGQLRSYGYLVLEAYEERVSGHHGLGYVVDQVEGMNMLRLKLIIDERSLSRAYVSRHDGLYPVGAWSSVNGEGEAQ